MWDMVANAHHDDLLREAARRRRIRAVMPRRRSVAARVVGRLFSVMRRPVSDPVSGGALGVGDTRSHVGGEQAPVLCGGPR